MKRCLKFLDILVTAVYFIHKQPPEVFYEKKEFLEFRKKETLAQVFSCEFAKLLRTRFLQNTSASCFCIKYTAVTKISKNFKQRFISIQAITACGWNQTTLKSF